MQSVLNKYGRWTFLQGRHACNECIMLESVQSAKYTLRVLQGFETRKPHDCRITVSWQVRYASQQCINHPSLLQLISQEGLLKFPAGGPLEDIDHCFSLCCNFKRQGCDFAHHLIPAPATCRESLIFDTGTIKLADFGLSKSLPVNKHAGYDLDSKFKLTGETGSYRYMAPEVFRHEPYNFKVGILQGLLTHNKVHTAVRHMFRVDHKYKGLAPYCEPSRQFPCSAMLYSVIGCSRRALLGNAWGAAYHASSDASSRLVLSLGY